MELIKIAPKDIGHYDDICQLLEEIIEEAKEGRVFAIGLVVLYEGPGRDVGTAFTSGARCDVHRFIGGVEYLKHRAVTELPEER